MVRWLALDMSRTRRFRGRGKSSRSPRLICLLASRVGPFPRCAKASSTTSCAVAAPSTGSSGPARPRSCRRRRSAGVSVSPRIEPRTSTPFGLSSPQSASAEDHVERLRCGVGDHVRGAGNAGTGAEDHDTATRPRDHPPGEVMAELHGHGAVAVQHRFSGLERGTTRNAASPGPLPRSRRRTQSRGRPRPQAREPRRRACTRSMASVRVSTPCRLRIEAATLAEHVLPASQQHHVEASFGKTFGGMGSP